MHVENETERHYGEISVRVGQYELGENKFYSINIDDYFNGLLDIWKRFKTTENAFRYVEKTLRIECTKILKAL